MINPIAGRDSHSLALLIRVDFELGDRNPKQMFVSSAILGHIVRRTDKVHALSLEVASNFLSLLSGAVCTLQFVLNIAELLSQP